MKDPSCVPDNTKDIHTKLVTWADAGKADIILTMGGAGLATKDVTSEATLAVQCLILSGSLAVNCASGVVPISAGQNQTFGHDFSSGEQVHVCSH